MPKTFTSALLSFSDFFFLVLDKLSIKVSFSAPIGKPYFEDCCRKENKVETDLTKDRGDDWKPMHTNKGERKRQSEQASRRNPVKTSAGESRCYKTHLEKIVTPMAQSHLNRCFPSYWSTSILWTFFLSTVSYICSLEVYVAEDNLGFIILLPPPLQCCNYRHATPCSVYSVLGTKLRTLYKHPTN